MVSASTYRMCIVLAVRRADCTSVTHDDWNGTYSYALDKAVGRVVRSVHWAGTPDV